MPLSSRTRASDKIDKLIDATGPPRWAWRWWWPIVTGCKPQKVMITPMPSTEVSGVNGRIPPPGGWSLLDAAAALFPAAWAEAQFPDDDEAARAVPGIQPTPSPWQRVPIEAVRAVSAAVFGRLPVPAELEAVVSACREHEAETACRIAAARMRRDDWRVKLPGILADRLAQGDFVARGVQANAPLRPVDIPSFAWSGAVIALGWEQPEWTPGRRQYSGYRADPPPAGSVRLSGNVTLIGVRVFAVEPVPAATALAAAAVTTRVADEPASPEIDRTGVAGRPTSRQFVEREHERRMVSGEAHGSVAGEAEHLARWLKQHHPDAPPMTAKTIENTIRAAHRRPLKSPLK